MSPVRRLLLILLLLLIFVLAANAAALVFYANHAWTAPGPLSAEQIHTITPGQGSRRIADDLASAGIIHSPYVFIAQIWWRDAAGSLRPGEYRFAARQSMAEVFDKIRRGEVVQHFLTIIEGANADDIRALLAADNRFGGDMPDIAEGSVLPDTYAFTRGETRAVLVARMQAAMQALEPELWPKRAADLPMEHWRDAVTLASIVEKETAIDAERGRVAAVYINRLRRGMPLQADPTVVYAMRLLGVDLPDGLRTGHLRRDHPYNTYTRTGLPPGPIAMPRRASIEAVLNPPQTDEYYFVADGKGGHVFAKSLAEHNRNVAAWRRVQRAAN